MKALHGSRWRAICCYLIGWVLCSVVVDTVFYQNHSPTQQMLIQLSMSRRCLIRHVTSRHVRWLVRAAGIFDSLRERAPQKIHHQASASETPHISRPHNNDSRSHSAQLRITYHHRSRQLNALFPTRRQRNRFSCTSLAKEQPAGRPSQTSILSTKVEVPPHQAMSIPTTPRRR